MPTRLYLDTARLGLMSASAQQLQLDFIRFAGEEGSSLYWDQFLRHGMDDWPVSLQDRFPALSAWHGSGHLKKCLKRLAGASQDSRVLLANRSAQLMRLAYEMMLRRCGNILVTDLSWLSYANILQLAQQGYLCSLGDAGDETLLAVHRL